LSWAELLHRAFVKASCRSGCRVRIEGEQVIDLLYRELQGCDAAQNLDAAIICLPSQGMGLERTQRGWRAQPGGAIRDKGS